MKVGSLFTGVGGLDLGFERQGFSISWVCEKEKSCRQILAKQFPSAIIYDNIKTVDPTQLSPVDIVIGGFPCQDLSVGGQRRGLSGSRSGLFYEFIRIVRDMPTKPSFVVVENVPGMLTSNDGRDFAIILREMVKEWGAKSIAWRILDSRYFGVPQRRERVYIVIDLTGERAEEVLDLKTDMRGDTREKPENGQNPLYSVSALFEDDVEYPLPIRKSRKAQNSFDFETWVETAYANTLNLFDVGQRSSVLVLEEPTVVRYLTPVEWERLQGFPDGWTEGLSDRARYCQMGNAVTVNVAEWIAKRIKGVYNEQLCAG
jgi:DNA (cytosine-5)-methyltransferase 1